MRLVATRTFNLPIRDYHFWYVNRLVSIYDSGAPLHQRRESLSLSLERTNKRASAIMIHAEIIPRRIHFPDAYISRRIILMATLLTLTYFASCFLREAPRVYLREFNYYEEPLLGIFLTPCRGKRVPEGINNGAGYSTFSASIVWTDFAIRKVTIPVWDAGVRCY